MTTFQVNVFLNRQEDDEGRLAIFARFGQGGTYREGDELEQVVTVTVEADSVSDALNQTYAMTNRGSDTFLGDEAYPQRSLSVGDVLEVAGLRYSVEGVGFQLIGDGVLA